MTSLLYTAPYAWIFWPAFVLVFARESAIVRRARRADRRGDAPADRGSLRVLTLTQGSAFALAFWFGARGPGWARLAHPRVAFWMGLGLLLLGAALRRWCFRTLGQWFTGEVRVREGQRVVTTGPYRLVRHPAYTAGLVMTLGIALANGTWLGALVAPALTLLGYAYRIRVEEMALSASLGEEYVTYMTRTKRLVPFVI